MKFKVGQKVRIDFKGQKSGTYGSRGVYLNPDMLPLQGTVGTIRLFINGYYRLQGTKQGNWQFAEEWLTPVTQINQINQMEIL